MSKKLGEDIQSTPCPPSCCLPRLGKTGEEEEAGGRREKQSRGVERC